MSQKKRRRHTPQQIVEKLKQADRLLSAGQPLGRVLQVLTVSEAVHIVRLGEVQAGQAAFYEESKQVALRSNGAW